VILATKGGDATLRDASVGALLAAEGMARGSSPATAVTGRTVGGLPAADLAIRLASQSVALRKRIDVWRGPVNDRRRIETTWQARFFAGQPNERDPWLLVLEQTEASLTSRNNGYWLKLHDAARRVAAVHVIHPDCVKARWNSASQRAEYRIRVDDTGGWSPWLGTDQILHFKVGYPEPGSIWCSSPVQRFRTALGSALAKGRFENDFYDRGLMQALAVVFDKDVKPEQARRFRELMQNEHGGVDNGHGTRVFGGGVTLETIGLSMADAQFIEGMQFDVEQIGRIFNVTPSLLHATAGHGSRNAPTPEHEEDRWFRYGLEPRLARIEDTVQTDSAFFGPGARDTVEFSTALVRADAKTESDILVHEVQAGIRTSNEARAVRGLPPLPGGDQIQVTPVGGAPNASPSPPAGVDTTGGDA
jgi:HK97 family phage portal protein